MDSPRLSLLLLIFLLIETPRRNQHQHQPQPRNAPPRRPSPSRMDPLRPRSPRRARHPPQTPRRPRPHDALRLLQPPRPAQHRLHRLHRRHSPQPLRARLQRARKQLLDPLNPHLLARSQNARPQRQSPPRPNPRRGTMVPALARLAAQIPLRHKRALLPLGLCLLGTRHHRRCRNGAGYIGAVPLRLWRLAA